MKLKDNRKINMKNIINIAIFVFAVFFISTACSENIIVKNKTKKYPDRIITLAPALTEIVYSIGAGDHIIGNTKFCNYPDESKNIKKIGGFLDINIEMILKLNPDMIICYPEHKNKLRTLSGRIELLEVKHISISDILDSINIIGEKTGKKENSKKMVKNIRKQLLKKKDSIIKKKVLLIADRDPHRLKSMYIIGKKGFLNEILELSGGKNSYDGNIPYPSISIESISSMNPDIIIEFSFFKDPQKKKDILKTWEKYSMINAVNSKNIFFVSGDFWQKPGPRISKIAEALRRIIN